MNKLLFSLVALSLLPSVTQAQMPYPYMPAYPMAPMLPSPMPYGMPYYPMPYGYPAPTMLLPAMPAQPAITAPATATAPAAAQVAEPVPTPEVTATPVSPIATEPAAPVVSSAPPTPPSAAPETPAPLASPAATAPVPAAQTVAPAPVAPTSAGSMPNPWLQNVPAAPAGFNPFAMMGTAPKGPLKPYTMRRVIPQQEKTQMMQMMVPMMTTIMRMDMAEAMNYFARKYKAKPGLSFDDVRDSLFLRANQLNMKKVGENLMWKDFQVVLEDKEAPRIEVYSFCDIKVGRDLLKLSPEFIVFLPCRVAIMEDADKNIWVLMIDWSLDWVAGHEKQLGISDELLKGAADISKRLDEMMQAAANGDL